MLITLLMHSVEMLDIRQTFHRLDFFTYLFVTLKQHEKQHNTKYTENSKKYTENLDISVMKYLPRNSEYNQQSDILIKTLNNNNYYYHYHHHHHNELALALLSRNSPKTKL